MKLKSKTISWLLLISIILIVVALMAPMIISAYPFQYEEYFVCTKCAMERMVINQQLPMIEITLFAKSCLEHTPLSRVLYDSDLVEKHQHEWRLGHGTGNGVLCALGRASNVWARARSESVAAFAHNMVDYSAPEVAQEWKGKLLDVMQRFPNPSALEDAGFPTSGFNTREQFEQWWQGPFMERKEMCKEMFPSNWEKGASANEDEKV